MHQRHKIPTIFNIYMLDVICCALGCVILLWQVSHQEAEEQTTAAKAAQSDAKTQSDLAVETRKKFEKARDDLSSASTDVTDLRAALAQWQTKHTALSQALALTEKEREDARKLAASRQDLIDKTRQSLDLTEEQLKKLETDLAKLLADQKKTNAELTGTQKINVELLAKIALADKRIASLKTDINANQIDLDKLLADQKKTNAELTVTQKINAELLAKLELSEKQIAALKTDAASKQTDLDATAKKSQDQIALLKLSDDNLRKLQNLLDSLRDDNRDTQAKLKVSELQLKVREQDLERSRKELLEILSSKDKLGKEMLAGVKDLAEAKGLIASLTAERDQYKQKLANADLAFGALEFDKKKLAQRVIDLQAQADQRFAGIPLTGESVVFLIDISGSMVLSDENTEDPEKWPFLCETLMRLMQSIPTLQRFQVILFSDKAGYLFANRDAWLKYEGPKTAQLTRDALKKVKVEGGTNMHEAFDEAFRYRKIRLDTIYLFSDGLPNIGPGVPAGIKNPTEAQKNLYMAKHIREKLKDEWNRPGEGQNNVRINAVGFFFESPDVGAFLWAMAREHRGSFVGLR
jgi:chromosome segregation ATPase